MVQIPMVLKRLFSHSSTFEVPSLVRTLTSNCHLREAGMSCKHWKLLLTPPPVLWQLRGTRVIVLTVGQGVGDLVQTKLSCADAEVVQAHVQDMSYKTHLCW